MNAERPGPASAGITGEEAGDEGLSSTAAAGVVMLSFPKTQTCYNI
jgi:hypothetical protein